MRNSLVVMFVIRHLLITAIWMHTNRFTIGANNFSDMCEWAFSDVCVYCLKKWPLCLHLRLRTCQLIFIVFLRQKRNLQQSDVELARLMQFVELHYIVKVGHRFDYVHCYVNERSARFSAIFWFWPNPPLAKFLAGFPNLAGCGRFWHSWVLADYLQLKVMKLDLACHHLSDLTVCRTHSEQTELT